MEDRTYIVVTIKWNARCLGSQAKTHTHTQKNYELKELAILK